MSVIVIGKVRDAHGCFGNMARYPVQYDGKLWPTTEALFQALRFDDEGVRTEIREAKSPMTAKMKAKKYKPRMIIEPMSPDDLDNMRLCLKLKIEQHPQLRELLLQTDEALIVEDCTKRQRGSGLFWGAAFIEGRWVGQNWLGRLWMELRTALGELHDRHS